jgi:hypothetical protein
MHDAGVVAVLDRCSDHRARVPWRFGLRCTNHASSNCGRQASVPSDECRSWQRWPSPQQNVHRQRVRRWAAPRGRLWAAPYGRPQFVADRPCDSASISELGLTTHHRINEQVASRHPRSPISPCSTPRRFETKDPPHCRPCAGPATTGRSARAVESMGPRRHHERRATRRHHRTAHQPQSPRRARRPVPSARPSGTGLSDDAGIDLPSTGRHSRTRERTGLGLDL